MLRLWIKTTSANDDAILILKLSGYRYRWWRPDRFKRTLSAIEREIGKSRRKAAPIVFVDQVLTESQMPVFMPQQPTIGACHMEKVGTFP